MKKVITYGTFDLLHRGHIRLLERAKALGDYLIVGVTSDDFDKARGKINVKQSLMERVEALRKTGIADEIIIEEYEGQKINDVIKYNVDIFTVGTDWQGKFDYLNEYCKVIYLERTEGVSSSQIRSEKATLNVGIIGNSSLVKKYYTECSFVNGIDVTAIKCNIPDNSYNHLCKNDYDEVLENADAVIIITHPSNHYDDVKKALLNGKHVLCESPIAIKEKECRELFELAHSKNLILMDSVKTAYSTAFNRMCLLVKSGEIGDVVSVDSTCTSLSKKDLNNAECLSDEWSSMCAWGPTASLPIIRILGNNYKSINIFSKNSSADSTFDLFSKADFTYDDAVASFKVGKGVKSEGELIITGTKGYIVVPAPWWKTDYFEIRYEDQTDNKRYFYQLEGEGIRNELSVFEKLIFNDIINSNYSEENAVAISSIIECYYNNTL